METQDFGLADILPQEGIQEPPPEVEEAAKKDDFIAIKDETPPMVSRPLVDERNDVPEVKAPGVPRMATEPLTREKLEDPHMLAQPARREPGPVLHPAHVETPRERAERMWAEEQEAKRQEFIKRYMEANKSEEPLIRPQPVAAHILNQTQVEMEAGRVASEKAAAEAALRPQRVKSVKEKASEGYNTPVFRPHDHVPNMKGQGAIKQTTLAEK